MYGSQFFTKLYKIIAVQKVKKIPLHKKSIILKLSFTADFTHSFELHFLYRKGYKDKEFKPFYNLIGLLHLKYYQKLRKLASIHVSN